MSGIIEAFSGFDLALNNPDFELKDSDPARHRALLVAAVDRIRQKMAEYPAFFSRFDYSWALDPASYGDATEANLQGLLFCVLPEISPEHPNFSKLGDIAVRVRDTAELACQSLKHPHATYKYILVNTSFMKLINAFSILNLRIARLGEGITDPRNPIRTNLLRGRDTAAALLARYDECVPFLAEFLATALAYAKGELPYNQTTTLTELLGTDFSMANMTQEALDWVSRYDAVEGFVLCHELGHLLEHDFEHRERNPGEELEADNAAASLYFILQSRGLRNAPLSFLNGPALFFHLATLFTLVAQIVGLKSAPEKQRRLEVERQAILARAWSYPALLAMYDWHPKKPHCAHDYWSTSSEVGALSTACRLAMTGYSADRYARHLEPVYFTGDHPELVRQTLGLVHVSVNRGNMSVAGSRLSKIIGMRDTLLTPEAKIASNPELAIAFARIAEAHEAAGRLDEAFAMVLRGHHELGGNEPGTARLSSVFARVARAKGLHDVARKSFERSIRLRADSPDERFPLAQDFMGLGLVERDVKNFEVARGHFRCAVELASEARGADGQDAGFILAMAATVEKAADDWQAVVPLIERSVQIDEQAVAQGKLPRGAPATATKYEMLIDALQRLDRKADMCEAMRRLVDVIAELAPADPARLAATQYRLAILEWQLENRSDALNRMRALVRWYESSEKSTPLELAGYLRELGALLYAAEELAEAASTLRQAAALTEAQANLSPAQLSDLGSGLHVLGLVQMNAGEVAPARAAFHRALDIWTELPELHAWLPGCCEYLAMLETKLGNPSGAESARARLLRAYERTLPATDQKLTELRARMGKPSAQAG